MSRFKRLKERKRKNRIKAVSCGLALTLAVGLSQGLGTYALFMDTENVSGDLAISTGDVDVEIDKKSFVYNDVQSSKELKHEFNITNHGTLNQNIAFELLIPQDDIPKKIYENIESYKIEFTTVEDLTKSIDKLQGLNQDISDIDILNANKQQLKLNDGNLFILNPGKILTCNVTIKMKSITPEIQKELSGKTLNLKLNIEATQLNDNSKIERGFYDIEDQLNSITIGEANIISYGNGMKYAGKGNANNFIEIDFNEIYPDVEEEERIKIIEAKGQFETATVNRDNGNTFSISLNKQTSPDNFSSDFIERDVIKLQFEYENGTNKVIKFDFRKNPNASGNKSVEAKYEVVSSIMEPPKEEIEVPIKPEIVEPPKEEIEVPTEPEIVEPPKEEVEVPDEPEEVEPPKEEIEVPVKPEVVEPPKQPEAIEPPKENEAIQE